MGKKRRLSSPQIIILGFGAAILLGAVLLMLPFATRDGLGAPLSDALFTATSAVCVTGLVVRDTATYWSGFGQGVLLLLIQVGGMGVVTFAVVIASAAGQRISLKQRGLMQDAISAPQIGGILRGAGLFFIHRPAVFLVGGAPRPARGGRGGGPPPPPAPRRPPPPADPETARAEHEFP